MISLDFSVFKNRLFLISKLKNIKAIFWDLDGTLWQEQAVAEHIYSLYVSHFSKITKKSFEESRELLLEFEKKGFDWAETISYFSQIPRLNILVELDKKIKRGKFINSDNSIEDLLGKVRQKGIRNFVASNMTSKNGILGLQKLGIKKPQETFDDLFFLDTIFLAKPDRLFFSKIIEKTHSNPNEALFVGDSYANDIFPAKSIGFNTCLIRNKRGSADLKYSQVKDLLDNVLLHLDR